MPTFPPDNLAAWTGGVWTTRPGAPLTGFGIDSRRIGPGQVFVALRTERRDGRDFVRAAAAAGAAAAIVSAPAAETALAQLVAPDPLAAFQAIAREHRRRFPGPVIGVTGSAGKTSTKELLALLLGGAPSVLATEGNLNNHLGVPLTLTRLDGDRHRFAVVEAGIGGPGEMAVLARMIEPDAAIVTLIGPAHLEELGGIEGVAREKTELLRGLRPGGVAVFPRSCEAHEPFRRLAARTLAVEASFRPLGGATEITLPADAEGAPETFVLPSPSEGMAANAALALRLARHLGFNSSALRERLLGWRPAPGRGEIRQEGGHLRYLDYYNANPASMRDALAAFRRITPGGEPRLYLLGGMEELGADEARFHRELGERLELRPQDRVVFVGSQGESFLDGARRAGARPEQLRLASTAEDAVALVAGFAGPIFVKGSRKHRLEEAFGAPTPAPASC